MRDPGDEQLDWLSELSWRRFDDGTYPTDFWDWADDNKHIVQQFVAMARQAKNAGVTRWSADAICHVLRWETAIRERGQNFLKINDHATAGLARLAVNLDPGLNGFFKTRTPPARDQARRLSDGRLYHESPENRH